MNGLDWVPRRAGARRLLFLAAIVLGACRGKKSEGERPRDAPTVAWKLEAGNHVSIAAAGEGTLLVLRDDSVVAAREGKVVWEQKPGKLGVTFIALPAGDGGGCVVVSAGEPSKLLCLSYADGATTWTATAPRAKPAGEGEGEGEDPSFVLTALQSKSTLATLLSDGRWAEVSPAACAAKKGDCVKASAETTARDPSTMDSLWVGADGLKARNRLENVAVYDAVTGKPRFVLDGKTTSFGVVTPKGMVLAGLDDDIVRVDGKACAALEGGDPPKISAKATSAEVPAGCAPKLLGQAHEPFEPALAGEDLVVVATRSIERVGEVAWKSDVDAASAPVIDGDTVYVACWQDTKDTFVTHVDLCALGLSDGKLRFRTPLDLDKIGLLDAASVAAGAGWVFIAAKQRVAAVKTK